MAMAGQTVDVMRGQRKKSPRVTPTAKLRDDHEAIIQHALIGMSGWTMRGRKWPVEVCCGMQFVMQHGEIRKLDTNKCCRDVGVGANFSLGAVNSIVN